jgi:hypothetical protein
MANERLVERLVGDLKPVRPRSAGREALFLALLFALEVALVLLFGQMRPDMAMAIGAPSFWWKAASLGVIALVGAAVALISFDPAASPRRLLRGLAAAVVACLIIGWVVNAYGVGCSSIATRLDWRNGVQCVAKMVVLSVPAIIGLAALMRRGAPTDTAATSLGVGIAAAAWGAFVFVLACPFDDPAYVAVWYSLGCGLVTVFARLALPRLTRW